MASPEEVPVRVLIINPNTSHHMTDALKPVVEGLGFANVQFEFFTSPTPGIPSINSPDDAAQSAEICLPALIDLLPLHDVFLVACYSEHPLVPRLKAECEMLSREATKGAGGRGVRKYVTGIFEASIAASLMVATSLGTGIGFGIVSTGKVWEKALRDAVCDFVGLERESEKGKGRVGRFVGCRTTGLNASELHELPAETVRAKMKDATKNLLRDGKEESYHVRAICLGCAGMVGLEEAVRDACVEELGEDDGRSVAIVDGVQAGVGSLITLARGGF